MIQKTEETKTPNPTIAKAAASEKPPLFDARRIKRNAPAKLQAQRTHRVMNLVIFTRGLLNRFLPKPHPIREDLGVHPAFNA